MIVTGTGGRIGNPGRELYLGNNGTAMRFLVGVAALGSGDITLTGDPRLCERPLQPLLEAIGSLGVSSTCRRAGGFPPVTVHGGTLRGGRVVFRDIESSQYVSSILIAAPYAAGDVEVEIRGSVVSRPYVEMTLATMKAFGVPVEKRSENLFAVKSGQRYRGCRYLVEGDLSSASYFFLAAALCGGTVRVANTNFRTHQGDVRFLRYLKELGCGVAATDQWIEVSGGKLIEGDFTVSMEDLPDMVPTLAVLAALRPGRTIIRNVAHLRIKESNRLEALVTGADEDGHPGRGNRRRSRHHGRHAARRRDRDLQRSPDRHELCRAGAPCPRHADPQPRLRREILPRLLGRAREAVSNHLTSPFRKGG